MNIAAPVFLILCAIALPIWLVLRIKRRWMMTFLMMLLTAVAFMIELAAIGMWFAEYM